MSTPPKFPFPDTHLEGGSVKITDEAGSGRTGCVYTGKDDASGTLTCAAGGSVACKVDPTVAEDCKVCKARGGVRWINRRCVGRTSVF